MLLSITATAEQRLPPVRPHIDSAEISPEGADPTQHLDYAEMCFHTLENIGRQVLRPDYSLRIKKLIIDSAFPIASGSTGSDEINVHGPPDLSTSFHESFHIFEIQGWFSGDIGEKHTSEGKTSPLFEAIPQIMAVLGCQDCLVGRQGRFEFAYDHGQPIPWSKLPTLRETTIRERDFARKRGLDTSYWDNILTQKSDKILNRPSAYYSSIPFGYALYSSLNICGQDVLMKALIAAYARESKASSNSFDSIKTFAKPFLEVLKEFGCSACVENVARLFRKLELTD